jgi:CheY-like chemotaxis protein
MASETILIVDDEEPIRKSLADILGDEGYEVASAASGREALDLLAEVQPSLALLDIAMPDMDGIETLRHLKEMPEAQGIPVIVVTTKGDPELVKQAFEAGCDDYVTKPIDKMELLTKIKGLLPD